MNDLCRVTADTNEYYDRIANTPDEVEPSALDVEFKMNNLEADYFVNYNDETEQCFIMCEPEWAAWAESGEEKNYAEAGDMPADVFYREAALAFKFKKAMLAHFRESMAKVAYEQAKKEANE